MSTLRSRIEVLSITVGLYTRLQISCKVNLNVRDASITVVATAQSEQMPVSSELNLNYVRVQVSVWQHHYDHTLRVVVSQSRSS